MSRCGFSLANGREENRPQSRLLAILSYDCPSISLKFSVRQPKFLPFQQHGYGIWGLLLASEIPIQRSEIQTILLPQNLQAITHDNLLKSFQFPAKIAQFRHDIPVHSLTCPQLFYFLLNPSIFLTEKENPEISNEIIDFLDWQEAGNEILETSDRLQLESIIRAWFEQDKGALNDHDNTPPPNLNTNQLLPVQHRYHSPEMTKEWLSYLKQLLAEIDLSKLLKREYY